MSDHNRLPNEASFDLKIFIKDVHDTHGRKRPLSVRPWASVKDVKDQLTKHLHVPASAQGIYFGPLLSSAKELPNHRTLQDAGIYRNGETLLLEIKGAALLQKGHSISSLRSQANDICVSSSTLDLCPKALQRLVQQARRGLTLGFKPALAPDGSGGSYFLSNARRQRVGVFKPADEEPFAENNPRGYVAHGAPSSAPADGDADPEWLRQGVRPGELCLREVAAYLLDHDGFSGVPLTTLAEARHPGFHAAGANWTVGEGGAGVGVHALRSPDAPPATPPARGGAGASSREPIKKVGSFQEFVHAECTMDDISPSKVSADEVHKIAILDIRLMNADRNVANILCRRIPEDPDHFQLVPIDHGYSLRSKADVAWFDWCWLDWPQTKQPLSRASREYVLGLDVEADVRLLKERLNMKNDVLDYFRSSCLILKAGVRAGLTLYDICSEIMCRNDPSGEIPSKFEMLTTMASELAMSAVHNGKFQHATASLALEEQLTTRHRGSLNRFSAAPSSSFKPRPMGRSASSNVFTTSRTPSFGGESAFTDEMSKMDSSFSGDFFDSQILEERGPSPSPPGLFHSSQSDDSTVDHEDADACSFASKGPSEDGAADEWAAALVALTDQKKVSAQSLLLLSQQHRGRSTSESSNGSDGSSSTSSKSAAGFWHIRPGSLSLENISSEDDEPICWTPSLQSSGHASSMESFTCEDKNVEPLSILSSCEFSAPKFGMLVVESPTTEAGFATLTLAETSPPSGTSEDEFGAIASPVTDKLVVESPTIQAGFNTPTMAETSLPAGTSEDECGAILSPVTGKLVVEYPTVQAGFTTPTLAGTSPPSGTSEDEFGAIASPVMGEGAPFPAVSCRSSFQPLKKAMSRSISYSAFSSHKNGLARSASLNPTLLSQSPAIRTSLFLTQENNLFRTYFMKFVDLLVVREMERLLRNTGPSMQGLAI